MTRRVLVGPRIIAALRFVDETDNLEGFREEKDAPVFSRY